jgi:hypothetical protein
MKVLLVEGAPGVGATAEEELRSAGHTVVGCEAADPSSPCRGLEVVDTCPLDAGDVDVAVVSRVGTEFSTTERGALCAARHRIPVVISGNPRHAVSFGPGTHLAGSDLVGACDSAARSGHAHTAAVERELLMSGVVQPDDVAGDQPRVSFSVRRDPKRLRLVVRTVGDEPRLAAITKAAAEALRRFDPCIKVIDVVTEHG